MDLHKRDCLTFRWLLYKHVCICNRSNEVHKLYSWQSYCIVHNFWFTYSRGTLLSETCLVLAEIEHAFPLLSEYGQSFTGKLAQPLLNWSDHSLIHKKSLRRTVWHNISIFNWFCNGKPTFAIPNPFHYLKWHLMQCSVGEASLSVIYHGTQYLKQ